MNKAIVTIISISLLVLMGCGQKGGEVLSNEAEHAHEEEEENKEEVHLVKRQMEVMGIEMSKFQYLNLSTTVKSNGQLELPPKNKASLSALMGGRIKSIHVLEGDYVKKGQSLASIEHPDFIEIQEKYLTAKSELLFLEKDYLRKKELHADSISSIKGFQQAESYFLSAQAKLNGLKARLKMLDINVANLDKGTVMSSIPVRSPINGFVRLVEVNIGKYVQPQQEMFEIVDNDHIHIDLTVYEKDLNKVEKGQKVIFSLSSSPDSVFQGNIFALGKSFEKEPKAMMVHAEIENKTGGLLPGMYVNARIITNEKNVRALPNEAVVNDNGLNYIFVMKPSSGEEHDHEEGENHDVEYVFRKIEVKTGATDIGFTEVIPAYNLPDHLLIVTKGAFYLLAEMKKGEGGHGHHH